LHSLNKIKAPTPTKIPKQVRDDPNCFTVQKTVNELHDIYRDDPICFTAKNRHQVN